MVTKSLLGKAHTVMAEGGMAAAMGNVDDRDNWRVHFADTMRGGQYLNNCRMAELHAKEAPARVHELEAWGAIFDRTKDGRILQRNFGGHRYPRLAHVGDRTGLEMIRTLQDHGIHQGIDVYAENTILTLLMDGNRCVGRVRLRSRARALQGVSREGGGAGDRRHRAARSKSPAIVGNTRPTARRWPINAGAALLDMEFVQFHPTGMVWPPSVKGILVTEGVRGEGGVLRNKDGKRFMFDDIPENYRSSDRRQRRRRLALHAGRQERAASAGAADARSRGALHQSRSEGGARAARMAACSWISPGSKKSFRIRWSTSRKSCPACITSSSSSPISTSRKEPMEVGPTTHYMMGGIQVDADTQMSTRAGIVRGGRMRRRIARSESPGRQFAFRLAGVRQARRRVRREIRQGKRRGQARSRARWTRPPRRRWLRSSAARRARIRSPCSTNCRTSCRTWSASCASKSEMQQALDEDREACARARRRPGSRAIIEYNTGWHTALDLDNMLTISEIDRDGGDRAQGKPRRRISATIIRTRAPSGRKYNLRITQGRRRAAASWSACRWCR